VYTFAFCCICRLFGLVAERVRLACGCDGGGAALFYGILRTILFKPCNIELICNILFEWTGNMFLVCFQYNQAVMELSWGLPKNDMSCSSSIHL
jgi:hypothetical protein